MFNRTYGDNELYEEIEDTNKQSKQCGRNIFMVTMRISEAEAYGVFMHRYNTDLQFTVAEWIVIF